MSCLVCRNRPCTSGVLCEPCASRICGSTALCPEQIGGGCRTSERTAFVDRWGRIHAISGTIFVGRRPGKNGLAIAEPSVSRRHATVEQLDGAWRVRDLASANGTCVNGEPVGGAVVLRPSDVVSFASVSLYFVTSSSPLPSVVSDSDPSTLPPPSAAIPEDDDHEPETFFGLRSAKLELIAPTGGGSGVLMVDGKTTPLTLVQYELLSTLANRMREELTVDERVRGFVRSTELRASLSWDASNPDDNHLKQLVRRARRTLARAGIADIIEARHGFGYRLRIALRG